MIPIRDLLEGHLTVTDLQRSKAFWGASLGLEIAQVFPDRKVAFTGSVIEAGVCSGCGKCEQVPILVMPLFHCFQISTTSIIATAEWFALVQLRIAIAQVTLATLIGLFTIL
jgi:hypothetical protein